MAVATLAAAPVALPYGYDHSYVKMIQCGYGDIVIRMGLHKHFTHTSLQHRLKYMLQQLAGIVFQRLDCGTGIEKRGMCGA